MEKDKLDENSFRFLDSSAVSDDPAHFYILQHVIAKKSISAALLDKILNFILPNFEKFCLPGDASNSYDNVLSMGGAVWRTLEAISIKDQCRKSISKWNDFPKLLQCLDAHVVFDGPQKQKIISVLLSNLCIDQDISELICENYPHWILKIFNNSIKYMGVRDYEKAKDELYILQNISQTKEGRKLVLNALEDRDPVCPFSILYLDANTPDTFRESVFGLTKNLTFDYELHEHFLDKEIIGPLLLPLVGTDVFSVEDNDKMHPDWQYVDKERDKCLKIKMLIMDTLLMLCNSKVVREKLRSLNVYLILREYHKVERNETLVDVLENVINILLRTEEEIGVEKLNLIYDSGDESKTEPLCNEPQS